LLDQVAKAGGTARATSPQYYDVNTADRGALQTALAEIAAKITASCVLDLGASPDDPGKVNVFFDEQPVAQSGADGWSLNGSKVTLLGGSCQKVLAGQVLDVRVVVGCPTVVN
jgi:hypothetical protein